MSDSSRPRLTRLSRSVAGFRVVITGAASGMGRATAHLFVDEGAQVVLSDIDADSLNAVVAEISAVHGPGRALGVVGDVSEGQVRARIVEMAVETWGGLDALVNNAGISRGSSLRSSGPEFGENWDRTLAVNLSAYAHLTRASVPWLTRAPAGGRVVNIASTEALVATGGLAAYTATKHAVVGLTKSCAVELGRWGVTVNCICPGPILTGMTAAIPEEARDKYARRRVPLRRYGQPEEVAHMTVNLCMPASSFVNGATVVVDGGMTINH